MPDAPKTAPFSRVGAYNRCTTQKPVICQFAKNVHLISALIAVLYKKDKIWRRFNGLVQQFLTVSSERWLISRNRMPQKEIVATEILVFDFELLYIDFHHG
jgi:hypothetical protein